MKIAYFDCFSGISGDMLIGSLLDAGLDFNVLEKEIDKLGLKSVRIKAEKTVKQNIASTRFSVQYEDQKHHRHLDDLYALVDNSTISDDIKKKAREVLLKIAVAEAKIHDMPLEKVHFHEIGAVDTIVDVVGALTGFQKLGIEKVYCSALNVGSGFVTFSHGKFPVPAPATAEILKDVPVYSTDSKGELVTPTGAAIITCLADGFGNMPSIRTKSIGYGAGSKDFEQPNVLRVYLGETDTSDDSDQVVVIETNIDDMNPQWYDHVIDRLYSAGALEVFLTSIQMKKNRPGTRLTILAEPSGRDQIMKIVFGETTSIGVRIRHESRTILKRQFETLDTPYGPVRLKISGYEGEILNKKIEYDDLKRIANSEGLTVKQVSSELDKLLNA